VKERKNGIYIEDESEFVIYTEKSTVEGRRVLVVAREGEGAVSVDWRKKKCDRKSVTIIR